MTNHFFLIFPSLQYLVLFISHDQEGFSLQIAGVFIIFHYLMAIIPLSMKYLLPLLLILPFFSYSQGIPVDKKNAQTIISLMEQTPVIVNSVKVKRMWKVYKLDKVMKSKFNHDVVQVKYTVRGKKKVKVFDLSLIEMDQSPEQIVTSN